MNANDHDPASIETSFERDPSDSGPSGNRYKTFHFFALFLLAASDAGEKWKNIIICGSK
jgi:hypothetical protein